MKTPKTAQEQTIANLDGDSMTGYDQQVAFDGDPSTRASLRFWRDGNPLNDAERVNALDGNPVHRKGVDYHGTAVDDERRKQLQIDEDRGAELRQRAEAAHDIVERRKVALPTPFDRRAPSPFNKR